MIGSLTGTLTSKHPNEVIIDVAGVGYLVHVPLSTYYGLGDPGSQVRLHVFTHVREDALALFGFATAIEKQLFERLIAIAGIGPRLAINILSGIEPGELITAVVAGNLARLTAIPGIGKKTAERVALELKDKVPPSLQVEAAAAAGVAAAGNEALKADLLSALLNLGYNRAYAEKAVAAALGAVPPDATFEVALKKTLRELSR